MSARQRGDTSMERESLWAVSQDVLLWPQAVSSSHSRHSDLLRGTKTNPNTLSTRQLQFLQSLFFPEVWPELPWWGDIGLAPSHMFSLQTTQVRWSIPSDLTSTQPTCPLEKKHHYQTNFPSGVGIVLPLLTRNQHGPTQQWRPWSTHICKTRRNQSVAHMES